LGSLFAKCYELHDQPRTIETPKGDRITHYGCLNFHTKRDGSSKLSLAIKNKWSAGWTKSGFHCHVPCWQSSEDGKSIYALRLRMRELDFAVEPEVECPNDDPNDDGFV
jgi:hypothetical protein